MTPTQSNRQVVLAARPVGPPKESDFSLVDVPIPRPGAGEMIENVGGRVFEAVLPLLNSFARVPVCGRIATYNLSELPAGPNQVPKLMALVLVRRLTLRGFIVSDHASREGDFLREMGDWLRSRQLKYREDIVAGLDNAVTAFQGLLEGRNFGKLLVRVSDDPTR